MWFKPKGWKDLSEEDRNWMQGAKNLDKIQKLRACVMDNKPERIRFLLNAYSFSKEDCYRAARLAIVSKKPEALQAVLDQRGGFDFSDSRKGDCEAALKLFRCVPPDGFALWKILWETNRNTGYGQLDDSDIIACIGPEMEDDFFRFHLNRARPGQIWIFRDFVMNAGMKSAEKLRLILGRAGKFNGAQDVLDGALAAAAEAGDTEKAELLLEKGADPVGGRALLCALEKDGREMFDLLLPHVNFESCGESLLEGARERRLAAEKIAWLEQAVDQACAEARARKNAESFALVDLSTLVETKQLPSGLKLTVLFNFKSRQQTTIVEKTGEAPSLAVTVTDFSDIGDHDFLEAMRLKLVALGGKPEPFTRLPKPGLGRG